MLLLGMYGEHQVPKQVGVGSDHSPVFWQNTDFVPFNEYPSSQEKSQNDLYWCFPV